MDELLRLVPATKLQEQSNRAEIKNQKSLKILLHDRRKESWVGGIGEKVCGGEWGGGLG